MVSPNPNLTEIASTTLRHRDAAPDNPTKLAPGEFNSRGGFQGPGPGQGNPQAPAARLGGGRVTEGRYRLSGHPGAHRLGKR